MLRHRLNNQATLSAYVTVAGLETLSEHPMVESIEPVFLLEPHLLQGISLMNASDARMTYSGQGVAVAICDTGIDYTHPAMGGGGFPNTKVIGGYDFGDNDEDPIPISQAHGTCCAGIAAGDLGSTGSYIGGVAYNAKLYALKITAGSGSSAYNSDIAAAWDWCVTHQYDDPNNPIMVISTSFGGGRFYSSCNSDSSVMTNAAANAVAAGITLLASSGNDGYCDSISSPSCISSIISVGAVYDGSLGTYGFCVNENSCATPGGSASCASDEFSISQVTGADVVTAYSNTASFLDVLAPSHNAYTTDIAGSSGYASGDYYTSFGGTSAACPYAAGAVACMQSRAKEVLGEFLLPQEIRDILTSTGDDVTDDKVAITKPRVNLGNAMAGLTPNPPTTQDQDVQATVDTPVTIYLKAADEGLPDPPGMLNYIITLLPGHGVLSDPFGGQISSVPYTLLDNGNQVVYAPDSEYTGPDSFQFKANDGGTAPDGGDSTEATVSIMVANISVIFSQDFESGLGGFVIDNDFGNGNGLWHLATGCNSALSGHSTPTVLYYGRDDTCNYDNATENQGVVTSPPISLAGYSGMIEMTVNYFLETEGQPVTYDKAGIEVSENGGPFVSVAHNDGTSGPVLLTDPVSIWTEAVIDLTAFTGSSIQIRFSFNTVDNIFNSYAGFYIDDVEITGVLTILQRTLTLSSTSGGSVSTPGEGAYQYSHGTVVDVNAIPDLHYHFVNWTGTGVDAGKVANPTSAGTTVTMDDDYTVQANFAIDTFTLDYAAGFGGSLTGDTSQVVDYNSNGTAVTAVPDTGYHFLAWSDALTENPRTDPNVTTNISVTANFAIDTFTLDYAAGFGGSLSGDTSQVVDYNSNGTAVTALPDTGYHFVDWSDASTDNPRTDLNVTVNISVTANFAIDTFTLDYAAGANGTLTGNAAQVVDYNSNGTAVTAVPDTGYHFVDWSDASTDNPRTDLNVTANINVTAGFAINQVVISGFITEPDPNSPVADVFVGSDSEPNAVTDPNGFYELLVDYGWSGIVSPSRAGYTFEPNSVAYDTVTDDSNDDYTATLNTFIISGYAVDSEMFAPLEGVLVSPDNDGGPFTSKYYGGSDITDANGFYEVLVDDNFSGNVVPSKYAYAFEPNGISHANVTADVIEAQDYVGTLLTYTITGYIENLCELPIEGVLVETNNGGGSDITDPNGYYEVWVGYNWSGTVTPTKQNYTFDPNMITYTAVLDDQVDQGYIATNIYDLDCNGSIGLGDLAIMSNYWLQIGPDVPGDFYKDEDEIVNFFDFAVFANVWGD